jgi:hypothetical protein
MQDFLRSCFSVVSKNFLAFVALNWLFFGFLVIGALLGQTGIVFSRWPVGEEVLMLEVRNVGFMFLGIFLFNLVLSGFLLVTLTGLAFFALPVVFLLYRALLWGALLNQLSMPLFLVALLTLVLEGESYVLAALAGVNLGLSWLKPRRMFEGENLSRLESVKKTLTDIARIYVLVVMFLFVAAVIETVTVLSL